VAAEREGKGVDAGLLRAGAARWNGHVELLLVEGVGGLLCPLAEHETIADLACDLAYPLIVITRLGLGTINHTLLTVEAALARRLTVAGIICNETSAASDAAAWESDRAEIAKRAGVPVLSVVRYRQTAPLEAFDSGGPIDWRRLATTGSATR
jgi:dethiobiotin synthetase